MSAIIGILSMLASLASLVFFIMVLIELFKNKGVLHGILGILCGLYTFIWGWINADRLNLRQTMMRWTIALVINIILGGAGFAMRGPQ